MIIFSPFNCSHNYTGTKYSISSFQPAKYHFPELSFLAPLDNQGERIRFSDFSKNPLDSFKEKVKQSYKQRWENIAQWLSHLPKDEDTILCCWCPYTQTAKEQIKKDKHFACHSGLFAQLIAEKSPNIVIMMDEKYKKLYTGWHPFKIEPEVDYEDLLF